MKNLFIPFEALFYAIHILCKTPYTQAYSIEMYKRQYMCDI